MKSKPITVLLIVTDPDIESDVRRKIPDDGNGILILKVIRNFSDALLALGQEPFDIVFLDLSIPDCGGVSCLSVLGVPVVVVTEVFNEAQALEAVRGGAEDYVVSSKMNSAAFERIVLYAMERHSARKRNAIHLGVSRVLAEAGTLRVAADGVLRTVCEIADCKRGEVWEVGKNGMTIELVSSWSSAERGRSAAPIPARSIKPNEGLIGTTWAGGRLVQEGEEVVHVAGNPESGTSHVAVENALAVPLNVGVETVGVLALYGSHILNHDEDFGILLVNIGNQVGQFFARKLAEEESERLGTERLTILDSTSEGIYGIDCDGGITFMNESAARAFHCTNESIAGAQAHARFHHTYPDGNPYPESSCPITQIIKSGKSYRTDKEYFWRTDGSCFAVDYSARPVLKDGLITGAVVSFNDISDKRQMEVELRHAQKLEAVGRLAAGIAHEINTPIQFIGDNTRFVQNSFQDIVAMISKYDALRSAARAGSVSQDLLFELDGLCETTEWDFLRTEIPKALEQALDGVQRVATIVRAMKEFSHVDRSSEKAAADLNRAIESTLIVASNEVKYVADVETKFADLPPVICHLGDLNQVFLNLLVNAAHAIADVKKTDGSPKGRIVVRTTCNADSVVVSISDTGSGIPKSIRDKVFDPFFTTKEVGKGTGQGLALARAIVVEKHGGTITFDTKEDVGTTFYIRLPINGVSVEREEVRA